MSLWPHQIRGLDDFWRAVIRGVLRIAFVAPTGGGKSRCMFEIIQRWDGPVVVLTHRKMLRDQLSANLTKAGIEHGLIASGVEPSPGERVQLAMIKTVASRVKKRVTARLPHATLVLVDEWHDNVNGEARGITDEYANQGATVCGFTATPLDMNGAADELIQAGVNSELRECGALVMAHHYGCPEPDLSRIKRQKSGEYEAKGLRRAVMTQTIFAQVVEHFRRLNPDCRPSLLFGPDVAGSLWFAEQFCKAGIPSAHIDAKIIWVDGTTLDSTSENREWLAKRSESGDVVQVCNRFVMREGVDWTWLYHCTFATAFGGLKSYLQAGGRVLRAHQSLDHCVIQDHGGHWHRLGSLNADRTWELGAQDRVECGVRENRMRAKKEPEPICCPKCRALRLSGPVCIRCGFRHTNRSRLVMQTDGRLIEHEGEIYKPRRTYQRQDVATRWATYYHRAKRSRQGMTFNQARALFAKENNWQYPPDGLPFMPRSDADWFRRVDKVPVEQLS